MDLQKLTHEAYEASRHWQLPLFAGLISYIRVTHKPNIKGKLSDLGDVPGDNILPKEILISLSSRRDSKVAY